MRMYTFTILYWAYIVAISIHFVASLTSAAKTPRPTFAAGTVLSLHMERFLRTAFSEDRTFVCHSMEEHYEYVPDMHVYLASCSSLDRLRGSYQTSCLTRTYSYRLSLLLHASFKRKSHVR